MVVRVAHVTFRLRDQRTGRLTALKATAVWARERGTTPRAEEPLDWLLLTNWPVSSAQNALQVIQGYAQRWRVEDAHKAWKSGGCQVEETQLRSFAAVHKWAILLAAVAARSERLKHLARSQPDQPATIELTPVEIRALILLRRRYRRRDEVVPDTVPSIGQAVLWLAEMGGYMGKSSGGPPGGITIRRGLEHLEPAAKMLEVLIPMLRDETNG
jgi:hypothetical protein